MEKFIGTSGYSYAHWLKGVFYPADWPKNKLLEYYCRVFGCVELNITFYRLPSQAVFKGWFRKTPPDFKFVLKGSRFITHVKRLKDVKNSIDIFFEAASSLGNKLLCVLWQLPASMKSDSQRLNSFIKDLKKNKTAEKLSHSFEFRNQTWFNRQTYDILEENNLNLCIAHSGKWPCQEVFTSNFAYLRFHGGESLYSCEYSQAELEKWAEKIKTWPKKINRLLAFFNNDYKGFAVKNAKTFRELLKR
ncbi:MAG: DUF72 domain-containing protein [Candidatus Omnitrophica bacterium]|nr:DUF72 domain-containing protein [Candidatus Omnitrophota bacterium]